MGDVRRGRISVQCKTAAVANAIFTEIRACGLGADLVIYWRSVDAAAGAVVEMERQIARVEKCE